MLLVGPLEEDREGLRSKQVSAQPARHPGWWSECTSQLPSCSTCTRVWNWMEAQQSS